MNDVKAIVEALIFASDTPLGLEKIVEHLKDRGGAKEDIVQVLADLKAEYDERQGGFALQEVAGGYQFRTRADLSPWIKRLRGDKAALLSPAALETLAVVAYRQPVVKIEIDAARGVDAGGVLKGLLDRKLIRIVGRKDVPGKPMLYGTTKKFLEVFNLNDISELPTLRELKDLQKSAGYEQLSLLNDE
ncbi:MAG: Segregation and condensation protein B [Syntrophus sp. SKADARSKE-3]|nr:Segregation and condensation protein B [Syntrophus sp. SKADARSKE-3]